ETPAHADYRRVGGPPEAIDIGLLGRLAPLGRDPREPPRPKSPGEPPPARGGPTLVGVERVGEQGGRWRARGGHPARAHLRDRRPQARGRDRARWQVARAV